MTDLVQSLHAHAASGRIWLRHPDGREVSYADLRDRSGRLANVLVECGVARGDRVLVQVGKTDEMLALYFACLRMGAVFLPVNPSYTAAETKYFIDDAEPALVLVEAGRLEELSDLGPTPRRMALAGAGGLSAAADTARTKFEDASLSADDLVAILYTSGTTGRSKGVMLTRDNLASNAKALVDLWQFRSDDVLLHALPTFHTHGLFVACNCVLVSGASMIFLPRFEPGAVLSAMPNATVMMGVPTYYTRLLAEQGLTRDVSGAMRLFVSGSAPLSAATHTAWKDRTGHEILERYGMTETNMITSNPYSGARIPGTVGLPLPDVDVRVADADTCASVERGAAGRIEVRGPNVFGGYWRAPEKTASEFTSDGWFITGDLGAFGAEDGYLRILGRDKDLIISGGLNVYPAEVENALDALPGVAASAVIGVPHPDLGEAVVAIVQASNDTLDPDGVRDDLRDRLAPYKLPKRVVTVDALPHNAMGKVQKAQLRDTHSGLFAVDGAD